MIVDYYAIEKYDGYGYEFDFSTDNYDHIVTLDFYNPQKRFKPRKVFEMWYQEKIVYDGCELFSSGLNIDLGIFNLNIGFMIYGN